MHRSIAFNYYTKALLKFLNYLKMSSIPESVRARLGMMPNRQTQQSVLKQEEIKI